MLITITDNGQVTTETVDNITREQFLEALQLGVRVLQTRPNGYKVSGTSLLKCGKTETLQIFFEPEQEQQEHVEQ